MTGHSILHLLSIPLQHLTLFHQGLIHLSHGILEMFAHAISSHYTIISIKGANYHRQCKHGHTNEGIASMLHYKKGLHDHGSSDAEGNKNSCVKSIT